MLLRELIDKFRDNYAYGIPSDDDRLRPRRVYTALKSARARVIADSLERHGVVSDFNYSTLPCIPLEKVNAHECGCIEIDGCFYYRSKCELPSVIGNTTSLDISTIDGKTKFSHVKWESVKYLAHNKWTSKSGRYFLRNNRLFLINNDPNLEVVLGRGILEDPIVAMDECSYCEPSCVPYLDRTFHMDHKFVLRVMELANKELYEVRGQEDRTSNTADSTKSK